ncbi:putative F-box WD-repeat [Fusarium albosuccineum]|uniref:Putative F-box WD-repeat n=1 Tax=Fusarium albosuccineum TaxID=1237068 RepID=A0A8H4KZR2_9HYPO|nr:putative F-box WD-repeat [Fusarium albosuccineum]
MSKKEALSSMDPFSPAHQPDEGYSEDPLTPTVSQDLQAALATLRSPSDLSSWLVANSSLLPLQVRTELTMALLDNLPTSVIAEIVHRLNPRLYIDFIQYLPAEICLKILGFLDPVSLVSVTQTCRAWYELALDRKLWERLYYMEGWKAITEEIAACEAKVNNGLNHSIRQLNRLQSMQDAHPNKIRAVVNTDEDLEMTDGDRTPVPSEISTTGSMFGSPSSSFSSSRPAIIPMGEMDLDGLGARTTTVQRSFSSSSDSRGKRKEPSGDPDFSIPPMSLADAANTLPPSSLYVWDVSRARYRINWRYLYAMRRRLESNWELGKYTTFQFPHPNFPEEGHQECVYTLQFDKNYLVSGSRDQTMRIWDVHTRRLIRPPLTGHMGSVLCLQFDSDPEEDLLVSGSSDSNVFIWKFSTGELIQKLTRAHHESVLNVRFDKRILVTSSKDKTIKIFNRHPLRHGDLGYGGDDMVNPVPTNLRRYGYEPDLSQELPIKPAFSMIGRLDGHSAAVNAIQVLDRTIVSVSGDRHIKVWNWPDQVCTQTIPAHEKGIACVEFDGRRIVSGSSDYEVCIFDAPTGLKVATLRGHAHLVRTVQAGFGDLPYSGVEDPAEAKAIDTEYFRAVEAGEIDHNLERRRRRDRRANAGSSRPQDLQAFGAKLPPGGGGGRKYGRIVSGSYDQSIIVWRRDKEGVWKAAHHLRQEEAAAAAQRDAAAATASIASTIAMAGSVRTRSTSSMISVPRSPPTNGTPLPRMMLRDLHGDSQRTAASYQALIDQTVPLGPAALQQSLATYPIALAHHAYLQSAIERETSPLTRAQLRGVVTDALATLQINQMPTRQNSSQNSSHQSTGDSSTGGPGSQRSASVPAPRTTIAVPTVPVTSSNLGAAAVQPPVVANTHAPGAPPAQPIVAGQPVPQNMLQAAGHHHPHIAAAENAPARVFKLQFDARKIVCCSQAPVIVGWDFCNKDPELEEAVRFFATVD